MRTNSHYPRTRTAQVPAFSIERGKHEPRNVSIRPSIRPPACAKYLDTHTPTEREREREREREEEREGEREEEEDRSSLAVVVLFALIV